MTGPQPPHDRGVPEVGFIMVLTLGACLVIVATAVLWDAFRGHQPALSGPTTGLLSATLGGVLGALSAYLGLGAGPHPDEPEDEDTPVPEDEGSQE